MRTRNFAKNVKGTIAIVCAIFAYFTGCNPEGSSQAPTPPSAVERLEENRAPISPSTAGLRTPAEPVPDGEHGVVIRISDGDTLHVKTGEGRKLVRLIGVDAPEIDGPHRRAEAGGIEAKEFVRSIAEGREARIVTDPQNDNDPHGRVLGYIYLNDGTFLNLEIIRAGHARVYRKFRFRERDHMIEAEREARKAGRGMWDRSGIDN